MAKLAIYKKGSDTPLAVGDDTSVAITGLQPNQTVAAGDYQAALTDGSQVGSKVDVPGFTTLPDYAAQGTSDGQADGAAGKEASDMTGKDDAYVAAYNDAYAEAKAKYDADQKAAADKAAAEQAAKDKADGTAAGKADGDAGKAAVDNSSKSKDYQDAYTAAYTPAKAAYDAAQPKPATGIKLQATMSLKVGDTKKPTLAADPSDAKDAAAVVAATTYKSSDETIATVAADGTITAVKVGTATITATSGTFTGDCKVTVAAAA
ncbi:Ig-like domain-containing protein [Lacticaseibacillus hulanensis]|uniref:Ig-like domain-containing protein n=1 Tax=Lacticaseibacillus hulanensis TaxID=2493111 RepID=UPI001F4D73C2|nr:Ig-like domain-containing protein [Lacticaseibacillus hulanensis]